MRTSARPHHFFDTRSVLLFAAFTMGSGAYLQARASAPTLPSLQSQSTPSASANPVNRPLALASNGTSAQRPISATFGPTAASPAGGAQAPGTQLENPIARPPSTGKTAFDSFDANKDGQLSAAEVKSSPEIATRLPSLDSNHDGVLSRREYQGIVRP